MEEDMIYIERKDGIKYYRKAKNNTVGYDKKLNIRVNDEMILNLKEIAERKNIKYQTLIRDILENYIELNKEV